MKRFCSAALLFLLLAWAGAASAGSRGTTSAEFLRLGVGRPAGMSEAGGSVARGAAALYWNPAGLAVLEDPDVYLSHNGHTESIRHDFLAAVFPLRKERGKEIATLQWALKEARRELEAGGARQEAPGRARKLASAEERKAVIEKRLAQLGQRNRGLIGYSLQVLTQGRFDKLDNQGNPSGTFTASDMAHTLAWAGSWRDMRAGLSLRLIRQTIDNSSGNALALGLGAQRDFGPWSAGASLANLGSGLALASESFPLPLTLRAGGSFTAIDDELFLAMDLSAAKGRGARLHAGAEYRVSPPWEVYSETRNISVSVRAGYTLGGRDSDGPSGFAAGGSADLGPFRADFAFQPFGQLGNSAQLGLGYRF